MIVYPIRYGIEMRVQGRTLEYVVRRACVKCLSVEVLYMESDRVFVVRATTWNPGMNLGKMRLPAIAEGAPYPWCNWEEVFGDDA